MKYMLMLFTQALILIIEKNTYCQTSDTTLNKLIAINETNYRGKPLDSILSVLPPEFIQMKVVSSHHRYTVRFLRVKYANDVWIELHVREFTHMNPVDKNYNWDMNLMKKEKLYRAVIYQKNDCFLNCEVW